MKIPKHRVLLMAGILLCATTYVLLPKDAKAQDSGAFMMQQQAVQNALMAASFDDTNDSKRKAPQAPVRPATLYRERVPGKLRTGHSGSCSACEVHSEPSVAVWQGN